MRNVLKLMAVVTAMLFCAELSSAAMSDSSMQPGSSSVSSPSGTMSSSDLNNQVQQHFDQARQAYASHDLQSASAHIRAASAVIAREEPQQAGGEERGLRHESERLDKLADQVQRGDIKNIDDLNKDFSKVQQKLMKTEKKGPGTGESTAGAESPEMRSVRSSFAQARDAFARRDFTSVQQSLNQAASQMRQAAASAQDPKKAQDLRDASTRVQEWANNLAQAKKKYDAGDLDGLINRANKSMVKDLGIQSKPGYGANTMGTQPQAQ